MLTSCSPETHQVIPTHTHRDRQCALRIALEAEARAPGNAALFIATRRRHPVLAAYASFEAVMAALADRSPGRHGEQDALTRALVVEAQRSGECRIWATVLLVAYWPMLMRLAGRIRTELPDTSEREQNVTVAFLETIYAISPHRSWLCLNLRRRTERRIWRHLHRERRHQRLVCTVSPEQLVDCIEAEAALRLDVAGSPWPDTRPIASTGEPDSDEREAGIEYLRAHAGHLLDAEELAIVAATAIDGERLTRYVKRLYPDLNGLARQRQYQRLKRRHSRAMAKLRLLFADHWERMRSGDDELPWAAATAA